MYKNITFIIKPHNIHAKILYGKIRTNLSNFTINAELKKYWPYDYWSKENNIGVIAEFRENYIQPNENKFFDIYIDHIKDEQYYLGTKIIHIKN